MAVLTKKCKRTAIGLVTGFANGLFGSGGGRSISGGFAGVGDTEKAVRGLSAADGAQ